MIVHVENELKMSYNDVSKPRKNGLPKNADTDNNISMRGWSKDYRTQYCSSTFLFPSYKRSVHFWIVCALLRVNKDV